MLCAPQYQCLIERKGKLLAALIAVKRLEQMQRAARLHILSVLEQQPGDLSQNEVDQIANEAKHQPLRRPPL